MTALLLAAAFACGAALPAMAEQATPETAAQPDPTEWADEAQDVTEAEEAPVYQQADAQEVATGETAASLTVTAADCTAQFIDEAYRLFLPVNTDMAALTIETGAALAAVLCAGLISCGWLVYAGKIDWLPASWTRVGPSMADAPAPLAKVSVVPIACAADCQSQGSASRAAWPVGGHGACAPSCASSVVTSRSTSASPTR